MDYISNYIVEYYEMLKPFRHIWLGIRFVRLWPTKRTIGNNHTGCTLGVGLWCL